MNDTDKKVIFLALLLVLLCVALSVGTWYPVHMLGEMREEYDTLESERVNLTRTVENASFTRENLLKLEAISPKDIRPAADIVEFYANVMQTAEKNNINVISTRQSSGSISLNLRGGYYSLMHLIADWREMPTAGKITSIKINRDKDVPALFVTADVTLAALIGEGDSK